MLGRNRLEHRHGSRCIRSFGEVCRRPEPVRADGSRRLFTSNRKYRLHLGPPVHRSSVQPANPSNHDSARVFLSSPFAISLKLIPFHISYSNSVLSKEIDCFAVSVNSTGGLQTLSLARDTVANDCGPMECFHSTDTVDLTQCGEFFAARFVSIVCKAREPSSTLFPLSMSTEAIGLCRFASTAAVSSLGDVYADLGRVKGLPTNAQHNLDQKALLNYFRLANVRFLIASNHV